MTTQIKISDVQLINLTLLLAIQNSLNQDPTSACYKFHLQLEDMSHVKNLSFEQIHSIVANVDQCLFCLRPEILDILNLPPNLAGILATVRNTETTATVNTNSFVSSNNKNSLRYEAA